MSATQTKNGRRTAGRRETQRVVRAKQGVILHVDFASNGLEKQPGAVGMDRQDLPDVDVRHDHNVLPWPFANESVLTIVASRVVAHVNPADGHFLDWMDEAWRVLRPGGQMAVVTPYGLSSLYVQDPTHSNPVNEKTFWYFDGDYCEYHGGEKVVYWGFYKPRPWKIEASFFSAEGQLEVSLRKRAEVPAAWLLPAGAEVTT